MEANFKSTDYTYLTIYNKTINEYFDSKWFCNLQWFLTLFLGFSTLSYKNKDNRKDIIWLLNNFELTALINYTELRQFVKYRCKNRIYLKENTYIKKAALK